MPKAIMPETIKPETTMPETTMPETMSKMSKTGEQKNFWLVGVDMGYGHQRTAYALKDFAYQQKAINANNYQGIPWKDRKIWAMARKSYEFISKIKEMPLVGDLFFRIFDETQKIDEPYPKRDLSRPNFAARENFFIIKKFKWGRHLIEKISQKPLPMLNTFFVPAFMAEVFGYSKEIFCIICDADIARTWVSVNPKASRIKYLAPTERVVERLKLYGVSPKNIFFTGYPLPLENIGNRNLDVLKQDLSHRLVNLDPLKKYIKHYQPLVKKYIGKIPKKSNHIFTIMFAVGGAGLQKEIGVELVRCFAPKIRSKEIKIILSAGIRQDVRDYFLREIKNLGLGADHASKGIDIVFSRDMQNYFRDFNLALRTTDILYTKPSELSFYTGLGIPIIMAPCVGSQEEFNRKWLVKIGAGMPQENPKYANQWIFDLLNSGWFARAAMQGFIKAEKSGTYNIIKVISSAGQYQ